MTSSSACFGKGSAVWHPCMHATHCVDSLFLSISIPSTKLLFFKVLMAPMEMWLSVWCHSSHVRAAMANSTGLFVFGIRACIDIAAHSFSLLRRFDPVEFGIPLRHM